uniref:NACHT domain-containing protein n=2 Tax=Sus scrofa TaxID=9823 RepID=A0A8D1TLZ4_PIG
MQLWHGSGTPYASERPKKKGKNNEIHTLERRRNTMEETSSLCNHTFWPSDGGFHYNNIAHRSQKLITYLNPTIPTQPMPLTVVLHGPAGVGKTTVAKKLMLDWTQDGLAQAVHSAFYLSCKDLSHRGTCTFAELIAAAQPGAREAVPQLPARAQEILLVVDGFEELRVPSGALVRDLCGDWKQPKPVAVLLGSLLRRKMLPRATLVITTRPGALRELRLLAEQPLFVEIEGFLEPDKKAYFLEHFGEERQALRAFALMKGNAALFRLGSAPAVCRIVCTCLKAQMEGGEDPASTCQTTTSLFLRFLCSQFAPAPGACPHPRLQAALRAACLLAAEGAWTQTSVFDGDDLGRLGLTPSALCPFLDKQILQKNGDCGGCYSFVHLSVQQLLAAMVYVLETEEEEAAAGGEAGGCTWDIGDVQKLLSKEERRKNPDLTRVGSFLFGLLNEERARELETTFGCRVSGAVRRELLKCRSESDGNGPFSSMMDTKEMLHCLHESQEEQLVKDAMAHVPEIAVHLTSAFEMVEASFCLKHCQDLRKISLQVGKRIFLENDADAEVDRSQHDQHSLQVWADLCSVFSSNENLLFLDVRDSVLSRSSVRILCEQVTHATCHLQKVVIKNISPADAYRDFCLAFIGKKTLTHLVLEGNVHSDKMLLLLLCEILKHARCNLQYLRLGSCSDTTQRWADFSSALKINQSLKCLDLTASEFLDEGVKLLCATLRHPKCSLQKLSLEDCQLTEACCKELSSALIVNQRLTHLCLAKNNLGDHGVKLLCEGLSYPECQLQTLVLRHCSINRHGCKYISKLLQGDCSLTSLDVGFNPITTGLYFLCEALKKPNCKLKCLGLWGCSITPFSCQDLASALLSNQSLETLDLGQNILGQSGVTALLEALKQKHGPLKTLRLKADESTKIQRMAEAVREGNPQLTVEWNHTGTRRSLCCDFLS